MDQTTTLGKRGLGAAGLPTGQAEILSRGPGEEAERLENRKQNKRSPLGLRLKRLSKGEGPSTVRVSVIRQAGEGGVGNAVRGIRSGKQVKSSSGLGL